VALAKQYLSYFQGGVDDWEAPTAAGATCSPQNRLRAYDVRRAVESIVDVGSVLELRPDYGVGWSPRSSGRGLGIRADCQQQSHLGGAIDAQAADKVGDFLTQWIRFGYRSSRCVTHRIHGRPEAEKDAAVRRFGRLFVLARD